MVLLEAMYSSHLRKLLRLQNPCWTCLSSSKLSDLLSLSLISRRPFSDSSQSSAESDEKSQKRAEPLSQFFRNAISGAERTDNGGTEGIDSEAAQLKEKLRKLEEEVRSLSKEEKDENRKTQSPIPAKSRRTKQNGPRISLSALFSVDEKERVKLKKPIDFGLEDPKVYKELSPEMKMFAHCLFVEGYLDDANFLPKDEFDATCFEMSYGREFLKFAAVKFGEDHPNIAKWLSASDLKNIALFGCPSYGRKSVYAAKHMRRFFEIEEQKVCGKCSLRHSCQYSNKAWNKSTQLSLDKVIQVLVMYAMGSVPGELAVPQDIHKSVSRLLKEIVNLSQIRL